MDSQQVFSGKNVEEAIAVGLTTLGLTREQVEVEVLDEGSRGIIGIGSREARVRLTPLPPPPPEPSPLPVQPDVAEAARQVLEELLEQMGFTADIRTYRAEQASGEGEGALMLEVRGPGADDLIGRRGETLAALQHLVRLIVRQRVTDVGNLVVDVEGYKKRRERNLRRLAQRMADKASRTGRTVTLEPMSPYERRIVHLTLRNRSDVYTESVGTGQRRRVTIIPRSGERV